MNTTAPFAPFAALATFALAALTLASCVAPAPTAAPPVDRTLSTSAEAEVKVAPDQAVLAFTVTADAATAVKSVAAVDGPTAKVLAAAKKRGVKSEHLQSAQVVVQPKYVYDKRGRATQVGVTGTRTINVVICDLEKLDIIVQEVLAAGGDITSASMRFDDSKLVEHKQLARVHAAEAARKKAESLAQTLGVKLGPARIVSEGGDAMLRGYEQWQNVSYNATKDLTDGAITTDTFAPGQVTVSASVQVVFDLEA